MTEAYQAAGNEYGGAADQLGRGHPRSAGPRRTCDEGIAQLLAQLTDIEGLLNDFNRDAADYMDSMTFDPEGNGAYGVQAGSAQSS